MTEKRNRVVRFKVISGEYQALRAKAEAVGETVSAYIRMVLRGILDKGKA